MDKKLFIFILKLVFLVLLIDFLYIFNTVPMYDCDACSFEINEKKHSMDKFFDLYSEKCISRKEYLRYPPPNFTLFEELINKSKESKVD